MAHTFHTSCKNVKLQHFFPSHRLPPSTEGALGSQALKQQLDFFQRKTCLLSKAQSVYATNHLVVIDASAIYSRGCGQQAGFFVITQR